MKLILEIIVPHFDEIEVYIGVSHNEDDDLEGIIVTWHREDKSAESLV